MSRNSKEQAKTGKDHAAHPDAPGAAGSLLAESKSQLVGLSDRWTVPIVCIFLVMATWFVFGQTIYHGFVNFDDDTYVYDNPVVQKGLTLRGIVWAFTGVHFSNWHPLTWLSHMLDCQFYGLNAGGHHLTNILLHMATVILLFLVLRQMTGALWRSAFVAAVFAIHPLRVESVAWIAERKDILSGLFFMLTIGTYVRYARRPWSQVRYGLVVFLFALGLMCKPMLVTLPFVLLLLDYWPLNRFRADASTEPIFYLGSWPVPKRLILEKLPLLGLAAASCMTTIFAQSKAIQSLPLSLRTGNALVSYVAYLGQMIYPVGLAVFYPYPAQDLVLWKIIAASVLLAISAGAVAARRKQPWFLFGWLWYLVMLVPVIGIVQVGSQAHADRYTYLPQIGLYVLLTWMVTDLSTGLRHRRLVLGYFFMVILVALIFRARAQTSYWRDSESLWTNTLAYTPGNVIAHGNLGHALLQNGNVDNAITHFQEALQIKPDDADAHINMGSALLQKGSADDAIAYFQKALQIKPDYAGAYYNLGCALIQKGSTDSAIPYYEKALQIKPDYAKAQVNIGCALFQKGRVDDAIIRFQKALRIEPDNADAYINLGNALIKNGHVDDAIVCFQKTLKIRPDYAEAHYNLGNALIQKESVDEAIVHYQKALRIRPNYVEAHINLGNALLENGRVDNAIIHFQKALRIEPDHTEVQNTLAWVLATSSQASLRNGNKAVKLAQRANQLAGGKDTDILSTLAAAYAETGRFSDAIRNARKAIELAQAAGQQDMVEELNGELKLYEAGLPFRQENK